MNDEAAGALATAVAAPASIKAPKATFANFFISGLLTQKLKT